MNIFVDTQDIEERYGEELYKEYLENENKQLKELCNKYEEEHKKEFNTWLQGQKVLVELEEDLKEHIEELKKKYDKEYFKGIVDEDINILTFINLLKEKYK